MKDLARKLMIAIAENFDYPNSAVERVLKENGWSEANNENLESNLDEADTLMDKLQTKIDEMTMSLASLEETFDEAACKITETLNDVQNES